MTCNKKISTSIRASVVALAALMPPMAFGQSSAYDNAYLDSISLNEVIVEKVMPKNITPNQVIGREIIEALPSTSVADALKYMAGVQVKDYGGLGGQKTVNVRSLGSQHVGVYIDGVRVTNAQNGTVDLGKYSLSTLESVSLFNANKNELLMCASEYASASTVYLQTKRPDKTDVTASGTIGSFHTYKGTVTASLSKLGFIDAAYTYSKGDYPFRYHTEYEDTSGTRRNSDIKMLRLESCLFHKGFQWHTYFFSSERGLPGGIVRRLSDTYTDVGREWDRNFFSQLSWRKRYRHYGFRAIAKYSNDHLHYRSDYPENISVHNNNKYHQQDLYGAFAAAYERRAWKVSASTDLRWSDLTTDVKNFKYVYRLDSKTSISAFFNKGPWNLNASGLYTHCSDHTRGSSKPLSKFTWNALGSFSVRHWLFRAFYKEVFRIPTLNDLYYTLVGNRNLKPEYTKQYNLGFNYGLDWFDIQVDGYYNRIEDRIVCLPLKGSYQWTMLNYGHTRSFGVDVSASAHYKENHLLITTSYQDDRNRTDKNESGYNDFIAYSPRWTFTGVYTFTWRDLTASVSHMFVDKRYWTTENELEPPLKAYNCTDIKVAYRMKHVSAEIECQNLFNDHYELIQRWPMPGRQFAFTIKYHLS